MSDISEWSIKEAENTHLDELTLSGEGGLYVNKIMCAVKAKTDEQDAKLAKVQGAYVFRGTVADMTALEAVEDPESGDTYSVTALGGENWAWNGTAWDDLGTSDANVVHKTGSETVDGVKTFQKKIKIEADAPGVECKAPLSQTSHADMLVLLNGDATTETFRIRCATSENVSIAVRQNKTGTVTDGAELNLFSSGNFQLKAKAGAGATEYKLVGSNSGSLQWNGQEIQTSSDKRLKTGFAKIDENDLEAWGDVDWIQFKFLRATKEKGDAARLHCGLVAQQVVEAFESKGLDVCKFGIVCQNDENNEYWTVRYSEAQAMEAAYIRYRINKIEERLKEIEAKLFRSGE